MPKFLLDELVHQSVYAYVFHCIEEFEDCEEGVRQKPTYILSSSETCWSCDCVDQHHTYHNTPKRVEGVV
eukprot:12229679-Prorocentrum_lima.AAC.1